MVRMAGRQQLNRQTIMHSHKLTVHGMDTVQIAHMPTIKRKLHPLLITRDNKDINLTHDDNFIIVVTLDHTHCSLVYCYYYCLLVMCLVRSCDPLQMGE